MFHDKYMTIIKIMYLLIGNENKYMKYKNKYQYEIMLSILKEIKKDIFINHWKIGLANFLAKNKYFFLILLPILSNIIILLFDKKILLLNFIIITMFMIIYLFSGLYLYGKKLNNKEIGKLVSIVVKYKEKNRNFIYNNIVELINKEDLKIMNIIDFFQMKNKEILTLIEKENKKEIIKKL